MISNKKLSTFKNKLGTCIFKSEPIWEKYANRPSVLDEVRKQEIKDQLQLKPKQSPTHKSKHKSLAHGIEKYVKNKSDASAQKENKISHDQELRVIPDSEQQILESFKRPSIVKYVDKDRMDYSFIVDESIIKTPDMKGNNK